MLCDTCDKPTLASAYQPANIYRHQGRICLVVCGDCEEDIKADNIRTDASKGSQLLNDLISRDPGLTNPLAVSGSFLGSWF